MGCSPFHRSSTHSSYPEYSPVAGNPNPNRFIIKEIHSKGDNHVVKIEYPDARNYEGNKILVYYNVPLHKITSSDNLDPHFADNGSLAPFARLEPTEKGWEYACMLASMLYLENTKPHK